MGRRRLGAQIAVRGLGEPRSARRKEPITKRGKVGALWSLKRGIAATRMGGTRLFAHPAPEGMGKLTGAGLVPRLQTGEAGQAQNWIQCHLRYRDCQL